MLKNLMQDINLFGTTSDYIDELHLYLSEAQTRRDFGVYSMVEEDVEQLKPWVIYPNSPFKGVWNVVLVFLLFYTATLMPYRIAFADDSKQDSWWYWELIVDSGFFFDIIVNCFSVYIDSDGEPVTNNRQILWAYIRSWMFIDIVAVFPFDAIQTESEDEGRSRNGYNTLLRLVRLPRLYRLVKLSRVLKVFSGNGQGEWVIKLQELMHIKHSFMRLLRSFVTVIICLHIIACLWYFAAKVNDFEPNTWVYRHGYLDAGQLKLYTVSFYWALTTLATVGYGDITPGTNIERCLAMGWMCFGMLFFSFTIGSLTSMLSSIDTKETVLSNKLAVIDEFAKQMRLGKSIQKKLRYALRYSTDKKGFSWGDKISIFNELPRNLKYEVAMSMHKGAAKQLPFFIDKDPMFICHTVPFLQTSMVCEGEYIFQEGEYADEIYFLIKGRAAFVTGKAKTPYKSLQANSYFGDIEIFKQIPRKYSAIALKDCELLSLTRQSISFIRDEFPSIAKEMILVAEQRDLLNTQTKKALKHLQMLKRTGKILDMTQEEIRQSVESYAGTHTLIEGVPKTTAMEDVSNFMDVVQEKLEENRIAIDYLSKVLHETQILLPPPRPPVAIPLDLQIRLDGL